MTDYISHLVDTVSAHIDMLVAQHDATTAIVSEHTSIAGHHAVLASDKTTSPAPDKTTSPAPDKTTSPAPSKTTPPTTGNNKPTTSTPTVTPITPGASGQTQIAGVATTMDAQLSGLAIGMTITSLLGTFIIGFSMIPQTVMTLKYKQTAKLSLAFYTISGIACFLLMVYGIGLCDVPWQGGNINQLNVLQQVGALHGNMTIYLSVNSLGTVIQGTSPAANTLSSSVPTLESSIAVSYYNGTSEETEYLQLNGNQEMAVAQIQEFLRALSQHGVTVQGHWEVFSTTGAASAAIVANLGNIDLKDSGSTNAEGLLNLAPNQIYFALTTNSLAGITWTANPAYVLQNLPVNADVTPAIGSAWGVTSSATHAPVVMLNYGKNEGALQQLGPNSNNVTMYSYFAALVKKAGYNVAMGFTLPGAAVVFGEFLVSLASLLIAYQKFANKLGAKKEHITEAEFEAKHYGHLLKANSSMRG